MQNSNVWMAVTKSRPLPGCEIDIDGCEFYSVDAFVPLEANAGAIAMVTLISQVKESLAAKSLELAEVILCARFHPEEWVDQTGSMESLHDLASKAAETGGIVFSGFRSEEIQDLYRYQHTVQELDE